MGEQTIVLITGGSSGFGRACVERLRARGFETIAASRSQPEGSLEGPGTAWGIRLDVDDDASVDRAISTILERTGRLDAVVNCAGFGVGGSIEDTSIEEAKAQFETNFFGTLRVCRAVLPSFRAQGGGRIINISSIAGRIAVPFQGLYSATKFALGGATAALRMEVRPFGVHVSLIEPGDFRTGFTDARHVPPDRTDGVYADRARRALVVAAADERGGREPAALARLVERVLRARSPRLRYTTGPLSQRLAAMADPFLPGRFVEREVMRHYNVL